MILDHTAIQFVKLTTIESNRNFNFITKSNKYNKQRNHEIKILRMIIITRRYVLTIFNYLKLIDLNVTSKIVVS